MRKILTVFCLIFLIGCGYKPISKIAKETIEGSVFVDVTMSKTDPQNTVAIKDAIRQGIVQRLGMSLADRSSAQSHIVAAIKSLSFTELSYDQYGYITSYKIVLNLSYKTKFKDGKIVETTASGEHDFSVARRSKSTRYADSIISDTDKFEAIKEASKEAFDEYIANLAIKAYQNGSNNR